MTRPNPQPELHNNQILGLARRFVTLPFVIAAAVYRGVRRLLRSGKSEKALYAEDQIRQSRVRRELRGLPPDDVSSSPKLNLRRLRPACQFFPGHCALGNMLARARLAPLPGAAARGRATS